MTCHEIKLVESNEWMKEWVALIEWNEKTWHETKWNEHEHEMTWTLT